MRRLALGMIVSGMLVLSLPGVVAAADTGPCHQDSGWFGQHNRWAGKWANGADTSKAGVEATFPASGGQHDLFLCSGLDQLHISSSQVWVDLELFPNNGGQLVQIGLFRGSGSCDPLEGDICDGRTRLFYSWGTCEGGYGCGGPNNLGPEPISLGLWEGNTLAFGTYRYIDSGVPTVAFTLNGWIAAKVAESSVPWISGLQMHAGYFCETWDWGDDCGGSAGTPYKLSSMVMKDAVGGPWIRNPVSIQPCDRQNAPYHCLVTTNSSLSLWATH